MNLHKLALAGIFFCSVAVGGVVLYLAKPMKDAIGQIGGAGKTLNASLGQLNDRIERKGGLADIAEKTMLHVDRVAGETAITASHERDYYTALQNRAFKTMDGLDSAIAGLNETQAKIGRDAHQSFVGLDAVFLRLPPFIDQGTATLKDTDALVSDPAIRETFTNIEMGTHYAADFTKHGDEMAIDFQGSLHSHLHPTRRALFFGGLWQAAKIAATHVP